MSNPPPKDLSEIVLDFISSIPWQVSVALAVVAVSMFHDIFMMLFFTATAIISLLKNAVNTSGSLPIKEIKKWYETESVIDDVKKEPFYKYESPVKQQPFVSETNNNTLPNTKGDDLWFNVFGMGSKPASLVYVDPTSPDSLNISLNTTGDHFEIKSLSLRLPRGNGCCVRSGYQSWPFLRRRIQRLRFQTHGWLRVRACIG